MISWTGDPYSLAASGLSAAGSGAKAFGDILSGDTAAQNAEGQAQNALDTASTTSAYDKFQAQSLSDAAAYGNIQAAQTDTDMRLILASKLGNIAAVLGATGADPTSPTGAAIAARTSQVGDLDREQQVGNIQAQTAQDTLASGYYQSAARAAIQIGNMQAGQYEADASSDQTSGLLGALGVGLSAASPLVKMLGA